MGEKLANLAILALLVTGVGWTIIAGLWFEEPDWSTCHKLFPQMQKRPILGALCGLTTLALFHAGAPELPFWKKFLYTIALMAEGHLLWPQD